MPKTFSFEEASAPNAEADQIRAGMAGPMGASNEEVDGEAQGTRASLEQVSDPQERQMLQEHLDATLANRARPQPGEPKSVFSFEEAARGPAQQPLPQGVKESTAGAGRGVVNPRAVEPEPATSGSTATDLVRNFRGGLVGGVAGAGAALASAFGAEKVAESLDSVRADLEQDQKDNGGDTIKGKAASLVGAVTPAMLLPAGKVAQLVGNAGLFAIPAFRDTLKAQLEADRSFPLALAHAAEAFGINLFMPTIATKGSAAVTKALGAEGAQGVKAGVVQGAQAAGEGAAFSAGSSVLDKATDKAALAIGDDTAHNDRDWVDLKDVAANALGFTALRAAHTAPQAVQAVTDRIGSPARQFGRAMEQDVQDAQFGPAEDAAAQQAGVTLNPNLARASGGIEVPNEPGITRHADGYERDYQGAVDDIATQLQAIRPLQDRAKKLRDAGEDVVADEFDRRANTQAADIELQAHPDADPVFQHYYRTLRADGAKPAEASNRAGMLGAFEQTASQAGISPKAVQAAIEKATGLPLAKVPQFLDRYVGEVTAAGIGTPVDIGHIASTVGGAGEAAMHRAIDSLYGREDAAAPEGKPAAEPISPTAPGMERFPPESGTLGLSRTDLPQIQAAHHGPLVNFLNARGIGHEVHDLDPNTLKPTQAEFSPEKVKQFAAMSGRREGLLVSSDGYVLDGHHRWLAAKEAGAPIKAIVLQAPIHELIDHVKEFPSAKSAEEAQGEAQAAPAPDAGAKEGGQATGPDTRASAAGVDTGGHPAAVGSERYGREHTPLEEGGKPFASVAEASKARKLLPHMKVVRTEGGYALAPKSAAQLAAEEQAGRRLARASTSEKGMPIPAHAFIAAEGGLRREEMADSGFDRNVKVGNRTLFAAAGKGLTIEQVTEKLQQAHYLPEGAGHNQAYDLIRKSVSDPQYNPEGWARIAENESNTRFEDYLKAEQQREDPLSPLPEEYLKGTGAEELTPEQHDELRALIAAGEAAGIDTEAHLEDAARKTENGTAHDYYEEASRTLQAATRPVGEGAAAREGAEQGRGPAGPEGAGRSGEVPREQDARRSEEADPVAAKAAYRDAVVAARKRESVLNSIRKCLGAP